MYQLGANSLFHCFLLKNPSSHNSGSGLYAVTRTAKLVLPFGIPQTTCMSLLLLSFIEYTVTFNEFDLPRDYAAELALRVVGHVRACNQNGL